MPVRRRRATADGRHASTLTELRKEAATVIRRLQRAGRAQLHAIEREIAQLNTRREALLRELNATLTGGRGASARGRRGRSGIVGRPLRIDWAQVYTRLPKQGTFGASDVKKLIPGVAPGTLSQRLTGWVREKKLRRTGSRRGTRYTRPA